VNALREQNIQVAAGSVGDAPAAQDQMYTISVRAEGRLTEASQFQDLTLSRGEDGAMVRVRDVGRVELGRRTTARSCAFWAWMPRESGSSSSRRPTRWRSIRPSAP